MVVDKEESGKVKRKLMEIVDEAFLMEKEVITGQFKGLWLNIDDTKEIFELI